MSSCSLPARPLRLAVVALTAALLPAALAAAGDTHQSRPFTGVKANTGTVTHSVQGGMHMLALSDDFKVPDSPAPHWQIVDSGGNVYLLQRLVIKGDKMNRTITVPEYVHDIARVQIWCSWAEVLLGETSFGSTLVLDRSDMGQTMVETTSTFRGSKANTGTATATRSGGHLVLTLSEDFVTPDTPAPHWQLVDSKGRTYLLQQLTIKGDKMNRTITVPAYVHDVAKVQIWCAFAETLLGEASFKKPVDAAM